MMIFVSYCIFTALIACFRRQGQRLCLHTVVLVPSSCVHYWTRFYGFMEKGLWYHSVCDAMCQCSLEHCVDNVTVLKFVDILVLFLSKEGLFMPHLGFVIFLIIVMKNPKCVSSLSEFRFHYFLCLWCVNIPQFQVFRFWGLCFPLWSSQGPAAPSSMVAEAGSPYLASPPQSFVFYFSSFITLFCSKFSFPLWTATLHFNNAFLPFLLKCDVCPSCYFIFLFSFNLVLYWSSCLLQSVLILEIWSIYRSHSKTSTTWNPGDVFWNCLTFLHKINVF